MPVDDETKAYVEGVVAASAEKITKAAENAQGAADEAAKREFDKVYYQAIIDTAKGSIDRARASGDLVQKAAAAIGTLYTGIIGVSFSVATRPITARALLPVLFLGIAITSSMVYLAFPTLGSRMAPLQPHNLRPERMRRQADHYLAMVTELVRRRVYWLRAAVVALGVGVVLLPAPFISDVVEPSAAVAPELSGGTTGTALVPFPDPPTVTSPADAGLEAIRYKAQVDEVVAARKSATTPAQESFPWWSWLALAAGLAVVFGVPGALGRKDSQDRRADQGGAAAGDERPGSSTSGLGPLAAERR